MKSQDLEFLQSLLVSRAGFLLTRDRRTVQHLLEGLGVAVPAEVGTTGGEAV